MPTVTGPTWRPHRCARSVIWPAYQGPDPDSPAEREFEDQGGPGARGNEDPADPDSVGGNYTLDDKLAALNKRRKDGGVCDTRHRDAVESAILRRPAPAPATATRTRETRTYEHARLVGAGLALTPAEEKQLASSGIVVPERLSYDSYTTAYYDVHRGQLPVYVTVDSILHAIFASHAHFLGAVEETKLVAKLDALLGAMHCGLPAAARGYSDEIAHDVDLYLTVARTLLAGQPVLSELGKVDQRAAELVELVTNPSTLISIELFGRDRYLDTTQFTPRGHYTSSGLGDYFRASMWLSRVDLNLVSRDTRASTPGELPDPRETPREAIVAVALADLAQRTQALRPLGELERAWSALAGAREDVSVPQLLALRKQAKLTKLTPAGAGALRAAIGAGFRRTVNTSPTPSVKNLPVIATLLGPRITPDTVALGTLIDGRGQATSAAELGYMLGHDRARTYIAKASLGAAQLADARAELSKATLGSDLYAAWLAAVRTLATQPAGAKPTFMETPAFADLRLNTAIAGYAQLRHNHVLVTAQAYDQGGCEIPDGYVEPAPATYDALAEYARRGAATLRALDPKDSARGVAYFVRVEKLMKVLARISREELANRPLSADARRFLAMIVERRVANARGYMDTYPVATFDGWYLDLFPNIDTALQTPAFIADFATYEREGRSGIHYAGAKPPRLGVFVVDTGGAPRLMVGPVTRAFQHHGDLAARVTDELVMSTSVDEPWAASYTVASAPAPAYELRFIRGDSSVRTKRGASVDLPRDVLRITSKVEHGAARIELLDHHFTRLAELPVRITEGVVDVRVPPQARAVEAFRVRIGTYSQRVDVALDGTLTWSSESPY